MIGSVTGNFDNNRALALAFCGGLPRYALFGVLLVLIHQSVFSSTSQSSRPFDWILIKFYQ